MLALQSADAAADLADFEANDLPTYAPVSFQRLARTPKGDDLEVRILRDLHLRRADAGRRFLHLQAP